MNRTVASARSFLAGLFSSGESANKIQAKGNEDQPLEEYNRSISPTDFQDLSRSKSIIFPMKIWSVSHPSILLRVVTRSSSQFPNPHVYPILKKCLSSSSLYQSLADDHGLKRARLAFLRRIGKSCLLRSSCFRMHIHH